MKLIQSIENASVFINFMADKTFRTGVRIIIEAQAIIYKHTTDNISGPATGKWKYDGGLELMDKTVMVGKRVLSDVEATEFLKGNKAADIDYLDKTIKAVEAEMELIGHDELAIQAGIILKDDPMVVEAKAQAKELGHTV